MDPVTAVGLVAALLQLIDVTAQTIQYINEVKDAPKQRGRLAREASGLLMLLTDLRYRVEEADESNAWFTGVRSLSSPLQLFKEDLEDVAHKLRPGNIIRTTFSWPFEEKQINIILVKIERIKTLVSLALQKDIFQLSLHIRGQNDRTLHSVEKVLNRVDELQASQEEQTRKNLYSWLSPAEFSIKQSDVLSRRQEGTGEWLLRTPEFKSWVQDSDVRTIWCPGIPGAGKTVLASIVVEHLESEFRDDKDVCVGYVFCSYKEHESHTVVGFIGNLLSQLIQQQDQVPDDVMTLYEQQKLTRTKPQLSELSNLLRGEVQRLDKVFFVVDALDECLEDIRYSFLKELFESGARLMVTSRLLSVVEHDFKFSFRLEIYASDKDVRRYVEARMISERRMARHVRGDSSLASKIVETLVESSKGMFLLSQLHMDFLAKKSSKKDVRAALDNLPPTLDNTYDEAMRRIHQQDADEVRLATQVLSWISHAFTSLQVRELQYALACVPGTTELDEEALPYEDDLVSVCAGLVDVDAESGVIRLVHYTTQKYFELNREKWFGPEAEMTIARSSLIYLSLLASVYDFCWIEKDSNYFAVHKFDPYLESTVLCKVDFPFAFYAACNWGSHARGEPEVNLNDQIIEFFAQEDNLLMLMITLWPESRRTSIPEVFRSIRTAFQYEIPGLFLAVCYNLPSIVSSYLDRGVRLEKRYGGRTTVLHVASRNGFTTIAKLLLEHGADIEAKGDECGRAGETPLHCAASEGHEALVRLLLDHGANYRAESATGITPLFLATAGAHYAVVETLLNSSERWDDSADVDSCLILAAYRGYSNITRLLLEANGNPNTRDPRLRTPLIVTVDNSSITQGHHDVVDVLLEKGADVRCTDREGNTAVDYAMNRDFTKIVLAFIQSDVAMGKKPLSPKLLELELIDTPLAPTRCHPLSVGDVWLSEFAEPRP